MFVGSQAATVSEVVVFDLGLGFIIVEPKLQMMFSGVYILYFAWNSPEISILWLIEKYVLLEYLILIAKVKYD